MTVERRIYLATSNPGKVREFQEAAQALGLTLAPLPELGNIPQAIEDGLTFEQNARKKAEHYSRYATEELVLAEDSGLVVDALNGAPGVYSARYAAMLQSGIASHDNSNDQENNLALINQLERLPKGKFAGKYVCVIALARNGSTLATFTGEAHGELLTIPRGTAGFGYDPLFYFPALDRTFAELSLEQKREHSHRGKAFRSFLAWYGKHSESLQAG
ncbi:MAG TPA: RdgB/HAM1 family non-canonical purine NTP pyrophosphatase [Candidatus Sulfotelmatobacter sp.]|jgi:XTP/dITP diphosphohydrolase|nr:RdgB/HAM1 family non-canonical purine NTP pyrophosphatase [Candidatus Sulfotelmatobacter sp.]